MDPDATWAMVLAPQLDIDERAVAATDLLVWLAIGGFMPSDPGPAAGKSDVADICRSTIFRALDRLAELEGQFDEDDRFNHEWEEA